MTATLLRNARLRGSDRPSDVLVADGMIRSLSTARHDLMGIPDLETVDLDGRHVGPGLWDQHVHVGQWALAGSRLDVSGATSAAEAVELVRRHVSC